MKIAILNDTHACCRNSSLVIQKTQEEFYDEVFFPYLLENGIKHILHLGDYYDSRKSISVQGVHANRKMFLNKLREHSMIMDIIPGNHDVLYTNTNEVSSLKELLGYFTDCVNIHMDPGVIDFDGHRILMIPWITQDNEEQIFEKVRTQKNISLVAGHFEFNGFSMMAGGIECEGGMATNDFDRFPMVISGHYHTKSTKGNVHYLGTQFEMTWSDYNDPKFFHIYDTETGKLTPIRNPNNLFFKFEYNDKRPDIDVSTLKNKIVRMIVNDKEDELTYRTFLHELNTGNLAELVVVDNSIGISQVSFQEGTQIVSNSELIKKYVESMGMDSSNEKRVTGYMKDLYERAIVAGATE